MDARRKASAPEPERAQLVLQAHPMPYLIKRSARRRTVSLTIDPERGLVVYCPRRLGRERIEALLRDKARWILEKSAQAARRQARVPTLRWSPGAPMPYQGALYPLELHPHRGPAAAARALHLADGRLRLYVRGAGTPPPPERLRTAVIAGYKDAARQVITERVAHFGPQVGAEPARVQVREQKRRWGSCSARGALSFNWRLILAPPGVMDYVIVHELCHLLVLDHSPRFWERVAAVLPDYRMRRDWLREYGAGLFI